MLEYAPMLHVSYYAQNYAGIVRQGLLLYERTTKTALRCTMLHSARQMLWQDRTVNNTLYVETALLLRTVCGVM